MIPVTSTRAPARCVPLVAVLLGAGLAMTASALTASSAAAHPHVAVSHRTNIVFDNAKVVAIDHVWFFDEFYSAMAVEGLDTNKDGTLSREELAELTKTNAEGLKDFDYFTFPKVGDQALKLSTPTEAWSEFNNGQLSLHFRVPLAEPRTDAKGFQVSVYDPTYFIAFDFVKENPVTLVGAPADCKADLGVPKQEADAAKQLSESFFQQLGGGAFALSLAKTVTISCAK